MVMTWGELEKFVKENKGKIPRQSEICFLGYLPEGATCVFDVTEIEKIEELVWFKGDEYEGP